MGTAELTYIKNIQREFKERFGCDLPIDFPALKGLKRRCTITTKVDYITEEEMQKEVENILFAYGATLERVRNNRIVNTPDFKNEHIGLIAVSHACFEKGWDKTLLSKIINKHRSTIYYYASHEIL